MKDKIFITGWFIWVLIILLIIILVSLTFVKEYSVVGQVPYPGPLPTNAPEETCENFPTMCIFPVLYIPLVIK